MTVSHEKRSMFRNTNHDILSYYNLLMSFLLELLNISKSNIHSRFVTRVFVLQFQDRVDQQPIIMELYVE